MADRIRYTAEQRLALRQRWLAALKTAHQLAGSDDRLSFVLNAQQDGLRAGHSFYVRQIQRWRAGDGPTMPTMRALLPLMEAVARRLEDEQ